MATQQPEESAGPNRGLKVGRVFGIPVYISWMWFVVALLLVFTYSGWVANWAEVWDVDLSGPQTYLVSAIFTLLLLGSVFLHELGHALTSKAFGLHVYAMTLWMLGGLTETEAESRRPGVDFVIALAGPAVNLVLALIGAGAAVLTASTPLLSVILAQLALSNALVGFFNLLPGLPLDGGTMLRAGVWKITKNKFRATTIAGWTGRVVAVGVVLFTLLPLTGVGGGLSFGLVFGLFIALFLWQGASQAIKSGQLGGRFGLLHTGRLAMPALLVPADLPLAEALRRAGEEGRQGIVVVDSENRAEAIVSGEAVAHTPEDRRPWVPVSDVARTLQPGLVLPATLAGEDVVRAVQAEPATEYLVVDQLPVSGPPNGAQIVGVLAARSIAEVLDPSAVR